MSVRKTLASLVLAGSTVFGAGNSYASFIERQITSDSENQGYPNISGNQIVWEDSREIKEDSIGSIYLWDPVNGEKSISNAEEHTMKLNPKISKGNVVWYEWTTAGENINMWNSKEGEKIIVNNLEGYTKVHISGNNVAYVNDNQGYLYLLNILNGYSSLISYSDSRFFDISGNNITYSYQPLDQDKDQFFMWDPINGERQITTDLSKISGGEISISGDKAVWSGFGTIYMWDPVNGERQISIYSSESYPEIDADTVVWQSYNNKNFDIFMWDPVNGERQVTSSPYDEMYPAIDGDNIVYQDNRNGNWDIYMTTITHTPEPSTLELITLGAASFASLGLYSSRRNRKD